MDLPSYQSLSITADDLHSSESISLNQRPSASSQPKQLLYRAVFISIFLFSFAFYGYCVFHALLPSRFSYSSYDNLSRRLNNSSSTQCTIERVGEYAAVGAAAGAALVLGSFLLVGLAPTGVIAGGLFASNMGAGIATGSLMAAAQSAAMTGVAYGTGAGVGAVLAPVAGC